MCKQDMCFVYFWPYSNYLPDILFSMIIITIFFFLIILIDFYNN